MFLFFRETWHLPVMNSKSLSRHSEPPNAHAIIKKWCDRPNITCLNRAASDGSSLALNNTGNNVR